MASVDGTELAKDSGEPEGGFERAHQGLGWALCEAIFFALTSEPCPAQIGRSAELTSCKPSGLHQSKKFFEPDELQQPTQIINASSNTAISDYQMSVTRHN